MLNTVKRLFGRSTRPSISNPKPLASGARRVRSLGHGKGLNNLADRLASAPEAHAMAIIESTVRGVKAGRANPKLGNLPWAGVHLMAVTFAPGTSRRVASKPLPIGMRGVQLGAATCVRGHKGHLHAYALVYIPRSK